MSEYVRNCDKEETKRVFTHSPEILLLGFGPGNPGANPTYSASDLLDMASEKTMGEMNRTFQ
jgi:hypothetical protein